MSTVVLSAWDFNANSLLTHLPFVNADYAVRLNDAGEMSVTVDLNAAQAAGPVSVLQGLGGNPFKLIFQVGSQILHAGYIYRYEYDSNTYQLKLSGAGLTSVFALILNSDIGIGNQGPYVDDAADVVSLVATSGPLSIGTRFALQNRPAQTTWTYSNDATVGQILADATAAVAPGIGGVDWVMEHAFTKSGQPFHTMAIYAPRAGQDKSTSGWSVDLTRALSWKWYTDSQRMTTSVVAVGSGAGSNAAVRATQKVTRPIGGLGQSPKFTGVFQFSQVNDPKRLSQIANGLISSYGQPVAAPTVTVPWDHPTLPLGGVGVGDDVLLTAPPCAWFPNGVNQWWRVVAYKVNLPDTGPPTVEYTFNLPPTF